MNPALQPFLTVALPIMVTMVAAMWSNNSRLTDLRTDFNRRFDDVNRRFDEVARRFDDVTTRLDRIERKPDNHEEHMVRVEERTSILHR